jgi:hypothetical protein
VDGRQRNAEMDANDRVEAARGGRRCESQFSREILAWKWVTVNEINYTDTYVNAQVGDGEVKDF